VTVMEKLIGIFEKNGHGQALALIALPVSTNGVTLAAAGVEPLEEIAPWIDEKPLKLLHILASDEPDGGARLLDERHMRPLLEEIDCIVVSASYRSRLTDYARIVLPTAIWAEKAGTTRNFQGDELPLQSVLPLRGEAREDKAILEALLREELPLPEEEVPLRFSAGSRAAPRSKPVIPASWGSPETD
jgi:NADH dehydrogenase/NADH:ubiquinone oxidoreductase subunit G